MDGKKENFKFLKNVSEKFNTLDNQKKKILIVSSIVVIALIILTIISSIVLGQTVGSAGKITGNLRNSGFVAEKGNKVFVSSTIITDPDSEKNGVCVIDSNNNAKIIDENEYVKSINLYKGNLYYLAINPSKTGNYIRQVVKISPKGEKKEILVDNIETSSIGNDALNVSDGWIYFLNSENKIEKIRIKDKKRQPVADEEVSYFQVSGKYIYYSTKDDEFKRMKKNGSAIEKIGNGIDLFQVVGNDVYYISKANQNLMKLDLKKNTDKSIIERKIKTFNIYEKTIYYAVNEENEQAIYKVKTNGNKTEKVTDLSSANVIISVVGNWVYYTDKVDGSPYYYTIYKVKSNGEDRQKVNI